MIREGLSEALALVRDVSPPTPITRARFQATGLVALKREDWGLTGTFKWRGALVACHAFKRRGSSAVVTASTGNHGAAVAWAAARMGQQAHIVLPAGSPVTKRKLIEQLGATIHVAGVTMADADACARGLARQQSFTYFEDGGSCEQIFGAATIGLEIAEAGCESDTIVIPVACGALASGIAIGLSAARSRARLVGVQSARFSRIAACYFKASYIPSLEPTIAEGLADDRLVEPAASLCLAAMDDFITVDDTDIVNAIRTLYVDADVIAEGAGAAALAAVHVYPERFKGQRLLLIVSGANIDKTRLEEAVQ